MAPGLTTNRRKRVHILYREIDSDRRVGSAVRRASRGGVAMTIAYKNLLGRAVGLVRGGDPGAADAICQHVLAVDPGNAVAMYVAGLVAHERRDHERSLDMMNRAIAARPDFADAFCGRGIARRHLRPSQAALDDFERAIALDPMQAQAHFYIGLALLEQNALSAAAEKFETALGCEPAMAIALANLGFVRHRQGQLDEAVAIYRRALDLDPSQTATRNNLAGALQDLGRAAEALEILRRLDADTADPMVGANVLTCLNLVPGNPQDFYTAAKHWATRFAEPLAKAPPQRRRDPERRLRIGYVAAHGLCRHTLAMTYLPLFAAHDPAAVEVFAYSDLSEAREDDVSARVKAAVAAWRHTGLLDDAALADQIAADDIDILVDGIGFAAGSRLLAAARRPAPVQVHFPAMSTTGMSAFDYVIGDEMLLPKTVDAAFAEGLWRLACGFLYQPLDQLPALAPPPVQQNGFITFGSFNRVAKVGPEAVALWAMVLNAVPSSRLVIKSAVGICAETYRRYRGMFAEHGVAQDRIELLASSRRDADELQSFNGIDIALDTAPFGGVLTTCAALGMGVPVVSWAGTRILERYGAAILTAAGFVDGIATDFETYVARAAQLANSPDRLTTLRPQLRDGLFGSSLCDGPAFARSIERAYRTMWRRWCADETRLS
jgi:protein O-GlcNAc transferase